MMIFEDIGLIYDQPDTPPLRVPDRNPPGLQVHGPGVFTTPVGGGRRERNCRRRWLAAGDVEDDLASSMPTLQDAVCLGRGRQREHVADGGPDGALVKQRRERPGAIAVIADEHAVEC